MDDNKSKSEAKSLKPKEWLVWAVGISAVIGGLIAVLSYFGVTPVDDVVKPNVAIKPNIIVGKANYRYIKLPSSFRKALRNTHLPNKISSDKEIKALLQKLPKESRDDAVRAISNYISDQIPYELRTNLRGIDGWWNIDIEKWTPSFGQQPKFYS